MPAPVVVEVTAASPEAPQLAAMLEACGRAVGATECVLARQAPEPPYEAVAIVTWEGEGRVRVEVGLQAGERTPWRSRELVFQATDLELERWRAIGFVVGTLATAARSEPEPAPSSTPRPEPEPPPAIGDRSQPSRDRPPQPEPRRKPKPESDALRRVWAGAGWSIADGLDSKLERNGAYGRVGFRPARLPVFACASLGYGTTSQVDALLTTSSFDAGLGLGVVLLDSGPFALDLALEAVGERFSAQASDPFLGTSERARWVGIARTRAELAWYWSDFVGASTFGEVGYRGGNTAVSIEGRQIGETATLSYGLGLGLSLRFRQ